MISKERALAPICLLPEEVARLIAAGEVIENPASVVKELFENAVDAGATEISVEVVGGGFQKIIVKDNGAGIDPKDLPLALQRHATSKIRLAEDLFNLTTLGFRGEGLASVAAISKLTITTRREGDELASEMVAEAGTILSQNKTLAPFGTSVEVTSLFFNVPARRKFQRSPGAASSEIQRELSRLALCHPKLAIKLTMQGKVSFDLPAALKESEEKCIRERAAALIEGVEKMLWLEGEAEGFGYLGLIATPEKSLRSKNGQYLFVDNHPIFSPLVSRAVKEGYGTMIAESELPLFLLYLFPKKGEVDINVHPRKLHVRFSEEQKLFDHLSAKVRARLIGFTPKLPEPASFTPFYAREDREHSLPLFAQKAAPAQKRFFWMVVQELYPYFLLRSDHLGAPKLFVVHLTRLKERLSLESEDPYALMDHFMEDPFVDSKIILELLPGALASFFS